MGLLHSETQIVQFSHFYDTDSLKYRPSIKISSNVSLILFKQINTQKTTRSTNKRWHTYLSIGNNVKVVSRYFICQQNTKYIYFIKWGPTSRSDLTHNLKTQDTILIVKILQSYCSDVEQTHVKFTKSLKLKLIKLMMSLNLAEYLAFLFTGSRYLSQTNIRILYKIIQNLKNKLFKSNIYLRAGNTTDIWTKCVRKQHFANLF